MQKEDIEKLAKLARIELTREEVDEFTGEITSILGYVSDVNEITGSTVGEKRVGALYNVFREDGDPHEPGTYTEDLLREAPEREGQYFKVQKILGDKK
jgi:aspartyl-tRNA(Asn)/glutamyl-tRNA(Gln) amidotransferase subunit C